MNQGRYDYLQEISIINGCGSSNGFNFSNACKHIILELKRFDAKKLSSLLSSIELRGCGPHDVRFHNGGLLLAFIWANLKFGYDMYKIFWWTSMWARVVIFLFIFLGTTVGGFTSFNWCLPRNKKKVKF